MMYVNPKIKDLLKKTFNIDNLKTIGLDTQGSTLTITLALKNGTKNNMQKDSACFEGWAIILKTYIMDKYPQNYNRVKLCCPALVNKK